MECGRASPIAAGRTRKPLRSYFVEASSRLWWVGEGGGLRVAGREKVLPVDVGHGHALLAQLVEDVQAGVGVLLQPVEEGQVVLEAVGGVVAEQAKTEVRVGEDEAAEVAGERLHAGPERDEVVVRREVAQLALVEDLLQRDASVGA